MCLRCRVSFRNNDGMGGGLWSRRCDNGYFFIKWMYINAWCWLLFIYVFVGLFVIHFFVWLYIYVSVGLFVIPIYVWLSIYYVFVGLFVIHIYVLNSLWTIMLFCLYSEIGLVMYNNYTNNKNNTNAILPFRKRLKGNPWGSFNAPLIEGSKYNLLKKLKKMTF